MYGKVMKVSEYELKFGAKEQNINVFICFKSLSDGNNYVIYSKIGEEATGKIYYGLLHIDKNKIVSMQSKEGTSEIIKEVVWKLINKESLDKYQVLDTKDILKIEIIGNSVLDMKPEVIKSLVDITIPKKEVPIENTTIKKKKNIGTIILLVLVLIFGISYLIYSNLGKLLGYGTELICEKSITNNKLDANITKTVTIYYSRSGKREKIIDNTAYVFNDYDTYFEFKDKGEFYKYEPSGQPEGGIKWEDDTNTFRTIVNVDSDSEYYIDDGNQTLPGNISEDIEIFQEKSYICKKQQREE
jgi:hypothetical protein